MCLFLNDSKTIMTIKVVTSAGPEYLVPTVQVFALFTTIGFFVAGRYVFMLVFVWKEEGASSCRVSVASYVRELSNEIFDENNQGI